MNRGNKNHLKFNCVIQPGGSQQLSGFLCKSYRGVIIDVAKEGKG